MPSLCSTMWNFKNIVDKCWIESEINQKAMTDCGFRIYRHDDYGFVFGIDGAGYDFYEQHWIPLYKARGLQWHLFRPSGQPVARSSEPAR